MWNPHFVGCLTGWIRKVEEEGMDEDGFILESSRVIMTLYEVAPDGKIALLGCTSATKNGVKGRQEIVLWNTVDRTESVSKFF